MDITSYTSITSKGQITIPKELRDHWQLAPGEQVQVRYKEGRAEILPLKQIIDGLAGAWGVPSAKRKLYNKEAIRKGMAKAAAERYRRTLP